VRGYYCICNVSLNYIIGKWKRISEQKTNSAFTVILVHSVGLTQLFNNIIVFIIRSGCTVTAVICLGTNFCMFRWNVLLFTAIKLKDSGPSSSVGMANGYGLDGPGIESRWGRDFLHLSKPALGPTQPPVQWVPGLPRR
jgi:hypothetical protein